MNCILEVYNFIPTLLENRWCKCFVGTEDSAFASLPPDLRSETRADLENSTTCIWPVRVREHCYEWCNEFGLQTLEHFRWHDRFRHRARCHWRNSSRSDVVLRTLLRKRLCEPNKTHLSRTVVRLANIAIESRRARGVDDASKLLRTEVRPGGLGARECTLDMNELDEVPFCIRHVLEGPVAENTSIIDENGNPTECVNRGLDNGGTVGD